MNLPRQAGQSTALAFKFISEAMLNPEKIIKIKDHYDSHVADRYLFETIRDIIDRLNLKGFWLTKANGQPAIKYDLTVSFADRGILSPSSLDPREEVFENPTIDIYKELQKL